MNKLKYRMLIQWSEEDECYLVSLPDFPGIQKWATHGNTYTEAVEMGIDAMEELIAVMEMEGEELPKVPELVEF